MPIIEDVTYDDQFQNKVVVWKTKKSLSGSWRMFRENSIRPRRIQQEKNPQMKTAYKIGDFPSDLALEAYHGPKPKPKSTPRNVPKLIIHEFENYCEKSTLHGLRYVGDTSLSFLERFFWVVAFGSAFAFACYYITKIFEKWDTNPVIVAFNPIDATFNDIPFPAITICNMNQVKRTEAERILQEQNPVEKQLLHDYCNSNASFDSEDQAPGWEAVQSFLIRAGQSCADTVKSCSFESDNISCEEYFNNDLTDEGLCCSFNRLPAENIFRNPNDVSFLNHTFPRKIYDWSPEKGFPFPHNGDTDTIPLRPSGSGTHLGLTVVVDAQLDNFFCSSTSSIGFKVILSNPTATPKIADFGFLVSPGLEVRLAIRPEIREATATLRTVDVEKRQCFFQDERPLKYYRSYTKRNCRLECQSNHTLVTCNCIPYYLPKSKTVKVCGRRDEKCANRAKEDMELVYGNGSSCNCLPSCYEMSFDISTTYSDLTTMETKYQLDVSGEYFKKNMAVLHFFFSENRFRRQIKSEIYGFTEVLSNVGGLLGLCFGFSFLSMMEIIYYLTLKLLCSLVHARKKRPKKGKKKDHVIPYIS